MRRVTIPLNFFENTKAIEYRILAFLKSGKNNKFKDIFENDLKRIETKSIRDNARRRNDIQSVIESCLENLEAKSKIYFDEHHNSWFLEKVKLRHLSDKEQKYLKHAHGLGDGWQNISDEGHAINWIYKMTPDDFEAFCCALLDHAKVQNLKVSEKREKSGADGGIDGYGELEIKGQMEKVLIQAKRYRPDNQITTNQIRDFLGAYDFENINYGFFITTSIFSDNALEQCKELNSRENGVKKIELIDKKRIIDIMLSKGKNIKGFGLYKTPDLDRLFINTYILKNSLDKYK